MKRYNERCQNIEKNDHHLLQRKSVFFIWLKNTLRFAFKRFKSFVSGFSNCISSPRKARPFCETLQKSFCFLKRAIFPYVPLQPSSSDLSWSLVKFVGGQSYTNHSVLTLQLCRFVFFSLNRIGEITHYHIGSRASLGLGKAKLPGCTNLAKSVLAGKRQNRRQYPDRKIIEYPFVIESEKSSPRST